MWAWRCQCATPLVFSRPTCVNGNDAIVFGQPDIEGVPADSVGVGKSMEKQAFARHVLGFEFLPAPFGRKGLHQLSFEFQFVAFGKRSIRPIYAEAMVIKPVF